MVTANIVHLSLVNQGPDMWLLQVLQFVLVRSSKMGAEASLVACDNDTAAAGGLRFVNTILCSQAGLVAGFLENICVLVLADAADIKN